MKKSFAAETLIFYMKIMTTEIKMKKAAKGSEDYFEKRKLAIFLYNLLFWNINMALHQKIRVKPLKIVRISRSIYLRKERGRSGRRTGFREERSH